jgi:hypothetical protein
MSKLGWLRIAGQIGLQALMFTPLAAIAPIISGAIQMAEEVPNASGAQKKEIARQLAIASAQITNAVMGRNVIDETLVSNTAGSAIDTAVGVTNLIHKQNPVG